MKWMATSSQHSLTAWCTATELLSYYIYLLQEKCLLWIPRIKQNFLFLWFVSFFGVVRERPFLNGLRYHNILSYFSPHILKKNIIAIKIHEKMKWPLEFPFTFLCFQFFFKSSCLMSNIISSQKNPVLKIINVTL